MKTAVLATIRRWDSQAMEWVRYHRAIGFDVLYLFVDEPSSQAINPPAGVRVAACDRRWWGTFASHPFCQELDPGRRAGTASWWHPHNLTLRQLLNAERAIEWALSDGVTWLLHIDGDELFHVKGRHVAEHFQTLEHAHAGQAMYRNQEALAGDDGGCPFTSLVFFRRNYDTLNSEQRRCVDARLNGRPWFLSYINGKSAVRVTRAVKPHGVHAFSGSAMSATITFAEPAILHYPYTTYQCFREKHLSLGLFDTTSLLGGSWQPPALLPAAQECLRRRDEGSLRKLYRDWVLMSAEDQRALRECGAVVEIHEAAEALRRAS